jgi:cyclic 2,3-diphosphoglycerate synthetase
VRVLAIVDGEHYAPVVRDAVSSLSSGTQGYEVVAAWLAGGTEKLRDDFDVGVPLVQTLEEGLARAEVVVDLSDEPVLPPERRFLLASRALAAGLPYVGADFRFDPPELHPVELPSLAVIGTGKRVGKTAVTGHVAQLLARDRDVVVVSMGRGGPPEPLVAETPPTVADLLERSRAGDHAASDYLETAALAGVPTIGCRRCGGGLAGRTFVSNVLEGARLAVARAPDVIVFDGSGAAIPPLDTGARVLVAHDVVSGLNPYRVLISDLVLTMSDDVAEQARALGAAVVRFTLRLRPAEPLDGRRVALFTTGPAPFGHLGDIEFVSRNLADRAALRKDLRSVDAEVYVVELKAAAIDVVAEAAAERGAELVLAANEVVPLPGEPDLDELLLSFVDQAVAA